MKHLLKCSYPSNSNTSRVISSIILGLVIGLFPVQNLYSQLWSLHTLPKIGAVIPKYSEKFKVDENNIFGARGKSFYTQQANMGYIFGGYGMNHKGKKSYLNDLWMFDLNSRKYIWCGGQGEPMKYCAKNKLVSTQDSTMIFPSYRSGSVCFIHNNKLHIFGGYGLDSSRKTVYFNDFWAFNFSLNKWEEISDGVSINNSLPTIKPSPRLCHMFWKMNNELFLLGGNGISDQGKLTNLTDFWKYDFISSNWVKLYDDRSQQFNTGAIIPENTQMPYIYEGGICLEYNNQLLLLGGTQYNNSTIASVNKELWKYTPSTNTWATDDMSYNNKTASDDLGFFAPQSKSFASYWIKANNLFVYGGYSQNKAGEKNYNDDFWKFDLSTNTWDVISNLDFLEANAEIRSSGVGVEDEINSPGSRLGAIHFTGQHDFLMIGGWHRTLSQYNITDEMWRYRIPYILPDSNKPIITGGSGGGTGTSSSNSSSANNSSSINEEGNGGTGSFDLTIYPNFIVDGNLNFQITDATGSLEYQIVDLYQVVHGVGSLNINSSPYNHQISITNLPSGEYYLFISQGSQNRFSRFTKN